MMDWLALTFFVLNIVFTLIAAGSSFILVRRLRQIFLLRQLLLKLCVEAWEIRPWGPPGLHHMAQMMRIHDDG